MVLADDFDEWFGCNLLRYYRISKVVSEGLTVVSRRDAGGFDCWFYKAVVLIGVLASE
ncbi:hypothetical protein AMTR_s00023p00246300, partial [Amborella trichopoda]